VKSITTFHYPLADTRQFIQNSQASYTIFWTIAVSLGRCCRTAGRA